DWVDGVVMSGQAKAGQLLSLTPKRPDPTVFAPISDPIAVAPIAGLLDTDLLTADGGQWWLSDSEQLGVAEVVNAHFVSRDTTFKDHPGPTAGELGPGFLEAVGRGQRRYFPKISTGSGAVDIARFVAEGTLHGVLRRLPGPLPGAAFTIDDRVNED